MAKTVTDVTLNPRLNVYFGHNDHSDIVTPLMIIRFFAIKLMFIYLHEPQSPEVKSMSFSNDIEDYIYIYIYIYVCVCVCVCICICTEIL